MAVSKTIKYLGIVSLAYFVLKSTGQIFQDKIRLGKVSIQSSDISFSRFALKLSIEFVNDNPVPLPIDSFIGNVLYGVNPLAEIKILTPITIPSNSSLAVTVDVNADPALFAENLLQIIQSGSILQNLSIAGDLVSRNLSLKVNRSIISI